jgi:formylglycine-generating enzyme required for sulfatase activity
MVSRVKPGQQTPIAPGEEKVVEQANTFSNQILILFSAPLLNEEESPIENLSLQKEIEAIASVLENIFQPVAVEIVVKVATSQTLQDVFSSRVKPLIIHFIGHGMRDGEQTALVLEDEVGMTRCFSEEELAIALSNHQQAPCQLALLNACHSEKLAQAFVKADVPHVIAVNAEDKILDVAARCFSRRLYQALFNQDSVVNGFLISRNAVKLDDQLKKLFNAQTFEKGVNFDEAFKFQLLPQAAHQQSLIIEPADSHQIIYPQWSKTNIAREDPKFVGRRKEIHQVIKKLVESEQRCLALHGMGGIGKTALAKAIGRWLHERDRYREGVWIISLRDTTSVGNLILEIQQTLELKSLALKSELRNSRTLLILDDLDGLIKSEFDELIELLNLLLEQCPNLRLLLTARDSLVRDLLYCHQEEVGSMGESETRQIFSNYAPSKALWGDDENLAQDFERLVKFLDGYPLPIKLAASYMAQTQSTLHDLCEDLDIEPLEILASYSPKERKERSLRITLERSFEMLSVEGQDIFPLLAFFPSGLSRDLAKAIWKRKGNQALLELFKYSMAEKSPTASDWRVTLPEPARTYAESKLQTGRNINYLASQVLNYYYSNFCDRIFGLFDTGNDNKGQQLLLQENSNLSLFLEWGYEHEQSLDRICRSARITASLSPYWRWIEPNQDPLLRLNSAKQVVQRNQDLEGEKLVDKAIATLTNRGEFKTVQTLSQEINLKSFSFQVITLNERGKKINREQKEAEYYTEILDNDIILDMVFIPDGSFIMGSPPGEGYESEKPQHQVSVPSFFIGRYPITQAQWKAVAELAPVERELDPDPSYSKEGYEGISRWTRPVKNISWEDAQEFCNRLSKETGRIYRLPTEAKWEYACRSIISDQVSVTRKELKVEEWNEKYNQPFHCGETISTEIANYRGTDWDIEGKVYPGNYGRGSKGIYREQTTPVGYFNVANNFGLSDMHGNVWEWCEDDWHKNYQGASIDGSAWLSKSSGLKVIRGGSWFFNPDFCRCAFRDRSNRVFRSDDIGFRVVCIASRTI